MTAADLQVAAVVVAHNSAGDLADLLTGLDAAMGELRWAVVVVDNGSTDDGAIIAREHGAVVIEQDNLGYAAGISVGMAALPAPAVLILNPDTRLAPGSVPLLLRRLGESGVGIVAPRVLDAEGSTSRSLRREPSVLRSLGLGRTRLALFDEYVSDPAVYAKPAVADWAVGAVLLYSRACHDDIGGWDASWFLYSEETDFCLRARDRGWATVYEPHAVATHVGGGSGRSSRTHAMQVVNRVRLYRRRHRLLPAAAYFAATALGEASRAARGRAESRAALAALVRPARRPPELGASDRLIPG